MPEVALDQTGDWDGETNWEHIAQKAVDAAFAMTEYVPEMRVSISINLSDNAEVQALNAQWRGKDKPTNVLSFPMLNGTEIAQLSRPLHSGLVAGSVSPHEPNSKTAKWMLNQVQHDGAFQEILLGDLILAHSVCTTEAAEKAIPLPQHVTHLIIHGTLHLLGLDHRNDAEAEHMEALEVKALASLGLPNPYNDR